MRLAFVSINSPKLKQYTSLLRTLPQKAIAYAIRNTLSRAAFDVKTTTMPPEAKRFIQRSPTFFKSQSKVAPARGNDINKMVATVGFMPASGVKESGKATKDLQQQEYGGTIMKRSFIPLARARTGNSYNRNVKQAMRLRTIMDKIVDGQSHNLPYKRNGRLVQAKSEKAKIVRAAIKAGKGGLIIGDRLNSRGNKTMFRVKMINRRSDGTTQISTEPVYSVRGKRTVHPKATHFMQAAALQTAAKLEPFYIDEAKKALLKFKI